MKIKKINKSIVQYLKDKLNYSEKDFYDFRIRFAKKSKDKNEPLENYLVRKPLGRENEMRQWFENEWKKNKISHFNKIYKKYWFFVNIYGSNYWLFLFNIIPIKRLEPDVEQGWFKGWETELLPDEGLNGKLIIKYEPKNAKRNNPCRKLRTLKNCKVIGILDEYLTQNVDIKQLIKKCEEAEK